MIFYSEAPRDLAEDTYKNLTSMLVYKGKQPTVSSYITGVNNGTYTRTGNSLLQAYLNVNLAVAKVGSTYRVEKTSPDGTIYGNYMHDSGIGEWAVLFDASMLLGANKLLDFDAAANKVNFTRNITADDLFMIVPVTDTAGVGVLRFNSVTFSSSVNNAIKKFTLNLF